MHLLLLVFLALLIFFAVVSKWPVRLYQAWLLKCLGAEFEVYSLDPAWLPTELNTTVKGRSVRVRFVDPAGDSLRAASGIEIRIPFNFGVVLQVLPRRGWAREWGNFKFRTSENRMIDDRVQVLAPDSEGLAKFFEAGRDWLEYLVKVPGLEQVLVNRNELLIHVKRFYSSGRLGEFLVQLLDLLQEESTT